MMKAINMKYKFSYPEAPTLYLEFSGTTDNQLKEQEAIVREITSKHKAGTFLYATTEKDREELWKARKSALFASLVLKPNAEILTTDVCVPISRLAECITQTQEDLSKSFLPAPLVGHVGDGNFHLFILIDPKNKEELAESQRLNDRLVARALSMDGTCTGEHGVGVGKKKFLEKELGPEALHLMEVLKTAIDPQNIMNPDKIFDLQHNSSNGPNSKTFSLTGNKETTPENDQGMDVRLRVPTHCDVRVTVDWQKSKL